MPFQNINQIRKKDEIERIARELEAIVKMPSLKDLDWEVVIAECDYPPIRHGKQGFQYGERGKLILTSGGLEDDTEKYAPKMGYEWAKTDTDREDSRARRNKVQISDFEGIISKYKISMKDVKELRSRLES